MQAIRTRYYGPTNTRGSRIVASCEAGKVSMGYDHALNIEGNHAAAARLLVAKFGWPGVYYGGVYANDYYWVSDSDWSPVASIKSAQSVAA
jgi:hypothetical protein